MNVKNMYTEDIKNNTNYEIPEYLEDKTQEILLLNKKYNKSILELAGTSEIDKAPYLLMEKTFERNKEKYESKNVNVIFLIGPNGCGKNYYIKNGLVPLGCEMAIRFTTRERRPDEKQGQDYYYISKEEFSNNYKSNKFIYATQKNYGTGRGLEKMNYFE